MVLHENSTLDMTGWRETAKEFFSLEFYLRRDGFQSKIFLSKKLFQCGGCINSYCSLNKKQIDHR